MMMQALPLRASAPSAGRRPTRGCAVVPKAFWNRKAAAVEEEEEPEVQEAPKKKMNPLSQVVNDLQGDRARSRKDAELLYDAKYGKRGEDGKMSREQYAALRRKIGGTYSDYFKDWVEEEVVTDTYTKQGAEGGTVPFLPLLVGITAAVILATVVVVAQTSS